MNVKIEHILTDPRVASLPLKQGVKKRCLMSVWNITKANGRGAAEDTVKTLVSNFKFFLSREIDEEELRRRYPFKLQDFDYMCAVLKSQPHVVLNFWKFIDLIPDNVSSEDFIQAEAERINSTPAKPLAKELNTVLEMMECDNIRDAMEIAKRDFNLSADSLSKFRAVYMNIYREFVLTPRRLVVKQESEGHKLNFSSISAIPIPEEFVNNGRKWTKQSLDQRYFTELMNFGGMLYHSEYLLPIAVTVMSEEFLMDLMELYEESISSDIRELGIEYHQAGLVTAVEKGSNGWRLIASPNKFVNFSLARMSQLFYAWNDSCSNDVRLDQNLGTQIAEYRYTKGQPLYGVDLSAASDNLPESIFARLVNIVGPEISNLYSQYTRFLIECPFRTPKGDNVVWAKGQPLGTHPSFAILSLTHNFVTRVAGLLNLVKNPSVILGDDVIITSTEVKDTYLEIMSQMDVPVNSKKTFGGHYFEFAGRRFNKITGKWYFTPDLHIDPKLEEILAWVEYTGISVDTQFLKRDSRVVKQLEVAKRLLAKDGISKEIPAIFSDLVLTRIVRHLLNSQPDKLSGSRAELAALLLELEDEPKANPTDQWCGIFPVRGRVKGMTESYSGFFSVPYMIRSEVSTSYPRREIKHEGAKKSTYLKIKSATELDQLKGSFSSVIPFHDWKKKTNKVDVNSLIGLVNDVKIVDRMRHSNNVMTRMVPVQCGKKHIVSVSPKCEPLPRIPTNIAMLCFMLRQVYELLCEHINR